ncbi:MAG TPA: AMP-binding protein, partial [Deltaproteobacteria bacterium]|nr:AMP-binding protein [Deltaproteobacteria bacterium]
IDKVKIVIDKSVVEEGATDGEIVNYGPNVMKGYHNKPEATAQVMTADGGIRTGDRGRIDEDGYLFITGRIKEQYKLENGKFVFPSAMEEDIRLIPYIENAMVYGENRPYNICLVIPDFHVLGTWAKQQGLPQDPQALVESKEVQDLIMGEIEKALKGKYGGYEIPKKIVLLTENFSVDDGTLTQTLKVKRRVVLKKHQDLIDAQYPAR